MIFYVTKFNGFFKIINRISVVLIMIVSFKGHSQVYINEVMINPLGVNDGSNMPNTAEWIELYNASASPVNIGCWFFTDGDFAVTFPSGTTIAAGGYFTIASAAGSGLTPNLDWATCGCTSGPNSQVGIFTNSDEQIILYNSSSVIMDAIIWGGGQLAGAMITAALGACTSKNVTFPAAGATYEIIGSSSGGITKERGVDGGATWQNGGSGTFGASNGNVVLPITLLDFYATKSQYKNEIIWKVASEENIMYYTIGKSNDGVNFTELGSVYSTNSTQVKSYNIVDDTPFDDITYYRLGTKETDGKVYYHKIISVDEKSSEWNSIHYQQEQNLVIEFKNTVPKNSTIYLFDLAGKLLAEQNITQSHTKINTHYFTEGIYFMKIASPYKTENFKIIISKN